jgi:hypothetical protein
VRRLYFDMLTLAEARGVARGATDTPLDLEPRLESTFRSQLPGQITRLFDDVRYGGRAVEADTVSRLRAQLDQLRQA